MAWYTTSRLDICIADRGSQQYCQSVSFVKNSLISTPPTMKTILCQTATVCFLLASTVVGATVHHHRRGDPLVSEPQCSETGSEVSVINRFCDNTTRRHSLTSLPYSMSTTTENIGSFTQKTALTSLSSSRIVFLPMRRAMFLHTELYRNHQSAMHRYTAIASSLLTRTIGRVPSTTGVRGTHRTTSDVSPAANVHERLAPSYRCSPSLCWQ